MMPNIDSSPYLTEMVQAQIAAFASEAIVHPSDRHHIQRNIIELAKGPVHDEVRRVTDTDNVPGQDNEVIAVEEGTSVITGASYIDYLRRVGGSNHESIRARAEILGNYKTFRPFIDQLREGLTDDNARQHPDFLGSGAEVNVFLLTVSGCEYAVSIPHNEGSLYSPEGIDEKLNAAIRGRSISGLEKVVAASYEEQITISELMPGTGLEYISLDELSRITDAQLESLIGTLISATEAGIYIDPSSQNVFYDPDEGFGIIDYGASQTPSSKVKIEAMVSSVGTITIGDTGIAARRIVRTPADEQYLLDLAAYKVSLLERYKNICERRLSEDEVDINKVISRLSETIESLKKEHGLS